MGCAAQHISNGCSRCQQACQQIVLSSYLNGEWRIMRWVQWICLEVAKKKSLPVVLFQARRNCAICQSAKVSLETFSSHVVLIIWAKMPYSYHIYSYWSWTTSMDFQTLWCKFNLFLLATAHKIKIVCMCSVHIAMEQILVRSLGVCPSGNWLKKLFIQCSIIQSLKGYVPHISDERFT